MSNSWKVYDLLLDAIQGDIGVRRANIGRQWTLVEAEGEGAGLAKTPLVYAADLASLGRLDRYSLQSLAGWILKWEPCRAVVGQAALNALLQGSNLPAEALALERGEAAELALLRRFLPRLRGKRVVMIGGDPGLDAALLPGVQLSLLPHRAWSTIYLSPHTAELISAADWVFLSANTLADKTFPLYAELARDTNLVLMGPATPWLAELAEFGVDYLAGVRIRDLAGLRQGLMSGEEQAIPGTALEYCVADIGAGEMQWLATAISDTVARREHIKVEMERWYGSRKVGRYPGQEELFTLDSQLSSLDSQFKRLWDARH